jgi:hypothetical protein
MNEGSPPASRTDSSEQRAVTTTLGRCGHLLLRSVCLCLMATSIAASCSHPGGDKGTIEGVLEAGGGPVGSPGSAAQMHPVPGEIKLTNGGVHYVLHTTTGYFVVRVPPGTYQIEGTTASDLSCADAALVRRDAVSRVTISCSIS